MLKDETTHRTITFHVWVKRRISSRTGRPIMSFFLQLKLLVWKNYTLRKRQWVGICHVIKMWELFWIPFSGSITCRDCLAPHTLSNSLPCQTQRAEKVSPWMWVLSFESSVSVKFNFVSEGHFEEKAMPSAGLIPFGQSFICTFNNTCHRNSWTQPGTFQEYNRSL